MNTRFCSNEKGASVVEFGVIVGLVSVIAISAVIKFGDTFVHLFTDASNELQVAELQEGELVNGGYLVDGEILPPSATCWEGTTSDDKIEFPYSAVYSCFNGYHGDDLIEGGLYDETIDAGEGNDTVYGNAGNDSIRLFKGNDVAFGGTGDDFFFASKGNDKKDGGEGNDIIHSSDNTSELIGGPGDDQIIARSIKESYHKISTGTGSDIVDVVYPRFDKPSAHEISDFDVAKDVLKIDGSDVNLMSPGSGLSLATYNNHLVVRWDGENTFVHLTNVDPSTYPIILTPGTIYGTNDQDDINHTHPYMDTDGEQAGDSTADLIYALGGDDVINSGGGGDTIYAGDGNDKITVSSVNGTTAYGENGNDELTLYDWGSTGGNTIVMDGGAGSDTLTFRLDRAGDVNLTGGAGADIFNRVSYPSIKGAQDHHITDFEPGVDVLQFDGVQFDPNNLPAGVTAADVGGVGAVITLDTNATLTIDNISLSQL